MISIFNVLKERNSFRSNTSEKNREITSYRSKRFKVNIYNEEFDPGSG